MENASKALIIAGAILLSILLISLGIVVYQNAQQAMEGANMDKTAIDTFNSQWSGYLGSKKKLSEVKSLLSMVASSNVSEQNGTGRIITVYAGDNTEGVTTTSKINAIITEQKWNASKTYSVEATYDDNDTGLITGIRIKQNTAAAGD